MGLAKRYNRPSAAVGKSKRWPALRLQALRRDGWTCVQCGDPGREVDHVLPVRTHPELGFELSNLQVLCGGCHSLKTVVDMGAKPLTPARREWRSFLKETTKCLSP